MMRIRWFGEPWPSAEARAPICDDDHFRILAPAVRCLRCEKPISSSDRGVAMAYVADPRPGFSFLVDDGGKSVQCCAYHLRCHIESILPPGELLDQIVTKLEKLEKEK